MLKCIVWDLDRTLWDGVLLEGDPSTPRDGVREVLETLDRRGVLCAIASRNDEALALARLAEVGLDRLFVAAEISQDSDKPTQIAGVARRLDLATRHVGFIDDDPSERAHVARVLPDVAVFDADPVGALLEHPGLPTGPVTVEASRRREALQATARMRTAEEAWTSDRASFLAWCEIRVRVREAVPADLPRADELAARSHRLNSNGEWLQGRALGDIVAAGGARLHVAEMRDRWFDHGIVGLVLTRESPRRTVDLLVVSCRAQGRGVAEALLSHEVARAREAGLERLHASYVASPYNRGLGLLFLASGFGPTAGDTLARDLAEPLPCPSWLA